MYRYLLFDADNTLFDFDRAEIWAFEATMAAFSLPGGDEPRARYHAISDGLWKRHERGEITLGALRLERFRRLFAETDPGAPYARVAEEYVRVLSGAGFVVDEGPEVIEALRPLCRIALVTNGIAQVQRGRLAASPYRDAFDAVLISEEIGFQKPDPRVVREALSRLGCRDPRQALLIGDSLTSDIAAARAAGIDSCWYNPHTLPFPEQPPKYIISNLRELLGIVP